MYPTRGSHEGTQPTTLHELVFDQAARTPDAVAVVASDRQMTYRETATAAVQLATHLRGHCGAGPDVPIGVLVDRGLNMVIGLLGVLCSGSAYLPLDTDAPDGHLRKIITRSGMRVCLTQSHLVQKLPADVHAVVFDETRFSDDTVGTPVALHPDHLVSVYFTSGSTGTPKGVANTHRGWVNRMIWMQRRHRLQPGETVLQKTTLTFDDSAVEVFWPLAFGGRVAMLEPGKHRDPRAIVEAARRHEAAVLQFVPSVLRLFLAVLTPDDVRGLAALRSVVSSGEALTPDLVAAFHSVLPGRELHNQWGVTEVSIDSTIWTCDPDKDARGTAVPIGYPIDGNGVHLLGPDLRPVPSGALGEIYLSGVGLARGYLNAPGRTAGTFVASPFGVGERMYRTGDTALRRPDGAIVFRGRADDQVKIRGIRVEPAETEHVLRGHPAVQDVAVTAVERGSGKQLVAYLVVRDNGFGDVERELRRHVADELAPAQVPSAWVFLSAMPLTPSGKVDRKALPAPMADVSSAPSTRTEVTLAKLWSDVLGLPAIDVDQNFFEAGGDSLSAAWAAALMSQAFGVDVRVSLVFSHPTVATAAVAITCPQTEHRAAPEIVHHPMADAPLSFGQERMLLLNDIVDRPDTYHCREGLRLRGPVDVTALRAALDTVVERHHVLRTVIVDRDGKLRQHVVAGATVPFSFVDLTTSSPPNADKQAHTTHPIRPNTGPVLAVDLIRHSPNDHVVLLTIHHIAFDDRSSDIFWRELGIAYRHHRDGRQVRLAPLPLQYADFAAWQRDQDTSAQADYWRVKLAGLAPLTLPVHLPAGPSSGAVITADLPTDVACRIGRLAAAHGTTPFTVLISAFHVVLSRYCGTSDVATGIYVSHRSRTDLGKLIGFFTNTVTLRSDLAGNPTFADLLTRVGATLVEALDHADVPYQRVVKAVCPHRTGSRDPLVQVAFALERVTADPWELPGLRTRRMEIADTTVKFDLSVTVVEREGRLGLTFSYDASLFDEATVTAMAQGYQHTLRTVVADPHVAIDSVVAVQHQPTTDHTPPADLGDHLHETFHGHAARFPDATAITGPLGTCTYGELSQAANRLADLLGNVGGNTPDTTVGVFLDRDIPLIAALLGVLTSGSTYLPLDIDMPVARLQLILNDARPSVIITHSSLVTRLPDSSVPLIRIDDLPAHQPKPRPPAAPLPDHLAYVIHTSGSTGRPKGVQITHRGLDSFAHAIRARLDIGSRDRVLAATTVSFDIAVLELLVPLATGAVVVLVGHDDARAPERLAGIIEDHAVTVVQATPSGWQMLVDSGWRGRRLKALCGGETLSGKLARAIHERTGSLVNLYGPTETTIWSTAADLDGAERTPPIGRALDNTEVRVLDTRLNAVPPGAVGELFVGGSGVARGYLNNPGLTAQRFVPDPLGQGRLYRTGDLVRVRHDGLLEFVGRTDRQVKVRGHRVELDEVEAVLSRHPAVGACAAVTENGPTGPRILAYATPRAPLLMPTTEQLRDHLRHHLPEYMVPGRVFTLAELPLTSNGKIDRAALRPMPVRTQGTDLRTAAERVVAAVFEDLLAAPAVGANDDFFALGGDSLLAGRAVVRLRHQHGLDIPLRTFLTTPTVARIAATARTRASRSLIPVLSRTDPRPLSSGQLRLWFLHRLHPDRADHHVPLAYQLDGPLDPASLCTAVAEVSRRHEVLRTRYVLDRGEPTQVIDPPMPPPAPIDLRQLPRPQREAAAERIRHELVSTPFDLAAEPPLRVRLIRLTDTTHHLVVVLHHIAADAWSLSVLTAELEHHYVAIRAGEPVEAPPVVQYADFAAWQRSQVEDDHLAYWSERLRGLGIVPLPVDHPRPAVPSGYAATHRHRLPDSLVARLRLSARTHDTTLFTVLLAAFHVLLARCGRTSDVATAAFVADRPHPDVESLIGFFVNTLVIRTAPTSDRTFTDYLGETHEHMLDAYAHQTVPFEVLVEKLQPDRDPHLNPLTQIAFSLNHAPADLRIPGVTAWPLPLPDAPAKVDLSVAADIDEDRLELEFAYHADLFEQDSVARLAARYEHVLTQLAENPETRIGDLSVITPGEYPLLLGVTEPIEPDTVDWAFHRQAGRTPDSVALVQGDRQVTYGELRVAVDRLAHYLRDAGIVPETPVGVHLDRGPDLVVALLSVLSAGGVYLPLDVDHPAERHASVLAAARPRMVLTGTAGVPTDDALQMSRITAVGSEPPRSIVRPEHLAYIVQTSGSTGHPKALAMTHRGAVNYLGHLGTVADLGPEDVVLQLVSPGFDASLREILGPLSTGATIVFPEPGPQRGPVGLVREAATRRVTVILAIVPTLLEALVHAGTEERVTLPDLRLVLVSGERLTRSLVDEVRVLAPNAVVVNQYGPSECTMTATYADARDALEPPVGRPIQNMRCYVLDDMLRPVPPGAPGEIFLAGPGLARGYLADPALTAAKLVPDPFGPPGERMYRTGDLGRVAANGDLVFLGRVDRQVKVRGVRVEPAEAEQAMTAHPDVRRAAVLPRAANSGLIGFYLVRPEATLTQDELRAHLARMVPGALVPDVLVPVADFPLTSTGKIDYGALDRTEPYEPVSAKPRDALELTVASALEETLGVARVGIDDDFFALGGHSLLALQAVDKLERVFGRPVPLSLIFAEPTVRRMCAVLRTGSRPAAGPVRMHSGDPDQPPLFLLHPQSGDICCYFDLVHSIDADLTVYGVEAVGYADDTPPLPTIELMADHYLRHIRAVAPRGPYFLAGWSFGGNVAYEITRRLERDGETVAFLGLIDSRVFGEDQLDAEYLAKAEVTRYAIITEAGEEQVAGLADEEALAVLAKRAAALDRVPQYGELAAVRRMVRVFTANGRAADLYQPTTAVTADIHLFKAERPHPVLPSPPVDPNGWARRTTGRLVLFSLPGDHHDLLREPYVTEVAARLSDALHTA